MIEDRFRAVLLRLELVSNGSTYGWNSSGGRSSTPDQATVNRAISLMIQERQLDVASAVDIESLIQKLDERGTGMPPHLLFAALYDKQASDAGRERVLDAAERELRQLVKRVASLDSDVPPLEVMLLEDSAGYSAEAAATRFNVDVALVRRIRVKNKRDTETGLPITTPADRANLAQHARELHEQGLSTRQIASQLDVPRMRVFRWLAKRHDDDVS